MRSLEFLEPANVEGAIAVLGAKDGTPRLIAGGSDLLGELKEGTATFNRLVSLGSIDSLRGIEATADGGLRIGAMTRIVDIEYSPLLTGPLQMLSEAARSVATPEIRNQGTLGGNLCQRPRCLQFRNGLTPCLKKGGMDCPAFESPYQNYLSIFGGPNCYATNPSDLAPTLIALDARVGIVGAAGRRELALEDFFTGPDADPTRENLLGGLELIDAVQVPAMTPERRGVYTKARERRAGDFAVVSVAVCFELVEGLIHDARVVLGGAAPTPLRCREAEGVLVGQLPEQGVAMLAAEAALAKAQPLAHNAYKVDQARALIGRGVMRVASLIQQA